MELLEELHQNGKTIIISTHDVELAYPWADRVILLRNGEILQEDIPEVAFGDPGLVRKAHLSMPILLELYQELVMRGLARQAKKPKTVLDMINIIEGIRQGSMTGQPAGCGIIRVGDVEMLAHGTIKEIITDLGITGVGVMGSRAKERLQTEGIYPDYTYAVIDRSILRGMIGESVLIITSGGMVGKVIERVGEFEKETGIRLKAEIIRTSCSPDGSRGGP
jgi:cobalt/nickel transport system ATP-binding protein